MRSDAIRFVRLSRLIGRPMAKPCAMSHSSSIEHVENVAVLDAFGDDLAAERVREPDRRLNHQAVAAVVDDAFDEALIDLDLVRRDLLQIIERRQAGAIIVDRDVDAELAQPGDHLEALAAARQRGSLGQLERQAVAEQPVAREQRRQAKREALVGQQPRRKVDRDVEVPPRLLICAAAATAFSRTKSVSLPMRLCCSAAATNSDAAIGPFLRVGPARQRLGADDSARREIELGLVGDPHFAAVDRLVELAEHRQLPRRILERLRIVILPLEAIVRGFVGGDERAGQTVRERPAAADLDAEGDGKVDRTSSRNPRRIAEQRVERFEMVAERLLGLLEPGEDSGVALIKQAVRRARPSSRATICSTSWRSLSAEGVATISS